jgi:hypothetical protein
MQDLTPATCVTPATCDPDHACREAPPRQAGIGQKRTD